MRAPDQASFIVAVKRGGEEGWLATAAYARDGTEPIVEHRDEENPFEAAWNALASVMTRLDYDEEKP
jgi:hypothetical protein